MRTANQTRNMQPINNVEGVRQLGQRNKSMNYNRSAVGNPNPYQANKSLAKLTSE